MKTYRLDQMKGGWFVGAFAPTSLATPTCEVAVKTYAGGTTDPRHLHRIATEVSLVLSGRARFNDVVLGPGEIVVIEPGEANTFTALEDTVLVVVKTPSAPDDKQLAEDAAPAPAPT